MVAEKDEPIFESKDSKVLDDEKYEIFGTRRTEPDY